MPLASDLIRDALRELNVTGRGQNPSTADNDEMLRTLQRMVASESVSRLFVPGRARHYFTVTPGTYTYGPGGDLDDAAPIKILDAYLGTADRIDRQLYPGDLYYSRSNPLAELRVSFSGDLVLDVLVHKQVASLASDLELNADAEEWLVLALADRSAARYGKQLSPRQVVNMDEAKNRMHIGNRRGKKLKVDKALLQRRR